MMFYIYSGVIPIFIITAFLFFNKPLNFKNIIKGITKTIHPLITYILLVYFLGREDYIDDGWSFVSLTMFFIPYLVIVLIINLIVWNKRRKA